MIYLILVSILSASAANFFPVDKVGANTTYSDQAACEKAEGLKCWEISNCDPVVCSIQDVDDPTKPIYVKQNVVACAEKAECETTLATHVCVSGAALINEDYTEVYCAVLAGYEKMKALALDPTKEQIKAAEKEAKRLEKEARDAKKADRLVALKTCISQNQSTVKQTADCMKALAREVLESELRVEEL